MRKSAKSESDAKPQRYEEPPLEGYSLPIKEVKDPNVYKYVVNEERFERSRDARKFMNELKKENKDLEIVRLDRYTYRVLPKKDAEKLFSQTGSKK